MESKNENEIGRLYIEKYNDDGTSDVIVVFGKGREKIFYELSVRIIDNTEEKKHELM